MNHFFKHFIITAFLLAGACSVTARVTINSADLNLTPGVVMTKVTSGELIEVDLGESGENQSWDFSDIEGIEYRECIVEPEGRPGADLFQDANICWYQEVPEGEMQVFAYANINEERLDYLGIGFYSPQMDSAFSVRVESEGPIYSFPVRYRDEWDVVTISDFMGTTITDSIHNVVDAWGTITDVAGEFECLRIQQFTRSTQEGENIETYTEYAYSWVAPDFGMIVSIESEENEENPDFTSGEFTRTVSIDRVGVFDRTNPGILTCSALDPAYPNPFNPQTNLRFTVVQPGVVTINICDINGRVVAGVVNGYYKPGSYQAPFKALNLSSGVYFAKFATKDVSQSQKLLLTK
ncbi:MAG: T9SS type A sorting domain-containing protein [Candidatus Hatepunaea meridiana]|nr:T9SS type A sorting domain-containing protein [Candidatus Hatepunaea meridiana]